MRKKSENMRQRKEAAPRREKPNPEAMAILLRIGDRIGRLEEENARLRGAIASAGLGIIC